VAEGEVVKYLIQGGPTVDLKDKDFLAEGGEGKVYVLNGQAFKVYADPAKVPSPAKVAELAAIKDPRVLRPEALIYTPKGAVAGYVTRYAPSGGVLCETFNRSWRDREGYDAGRMGELVEKLRSLVANVHTARVLIVDLNEMNFLLDPSKRDLWAIDVASYQTPNHRATALMESVRDRHVKGNAFTEGSDWFSFAILAFRMWIGIHPYRGSHPKLKTMDDRMLANVSVLNPDVKTPGACYPTTDIPPAYLDWFRRVFDRGERLPPPDRMRPLSPVAAPVAARTWAGGGSVRVLRQDYPSGILGALYAETLYGDLVIVTADRVWVNGHADGHPPGKPSRGVIRNPRGGYLTAHLEGETASVYGPDGVQVESLAGVRSLETCDGYAYAHHSDSSSILRSKMTAAGVCWEVAVRLANQSGFLFRGGVYQSLLSSAYIHVFNEPESSLALRLPELDKTRPVAARYERGVLVVDARDGVRRIYRVSATGEHDLWGSMPAAGDLDFAVLPSGVCVMREGDSLTLFSGRYGGSTAARRVDLPPSLTGAGPLTVTRAGELGTMTRDDGVLVLTLS
jgi:uncharacterized protein (DUF3820 family)